MVKIPRCTSTQHPDNVNLPFFAQNAQLSGEDEIQEAYYAFSHLGCDEQMWDCEGKEVDNYVVKKLPTLYEPFFRERRLGEDVFVTLRVPNPTVERAEAKILLETLESIPQSFDAAKLFYRDETPPIFEVILPLTSSARCLDRVYRYYSEFVVGKQDRAFRDGDITIANWIGEFKPERITVIPLFETMEQMLQLAPLINELAGHVPNRRRRKLHIGLFGYARDLEGVKLPRAIKFTATLYSIGLPPEVLGLNALDEADLRFIRQDYLHFDDDLRDALRYLSPAAPEFLGEGLSLDEIPLEFQIDEEHQALTTQVIGALRGEQKTEMGELVLWAANLRRFLG